MSPRSAISSANSLLWALWACGPLAQQRRPHSPLAPSRREEFPFAVLAVLAVCYLYLQNSLGSHCTTDLSSRRPLSYFNVSLVKGKNTLQPYYIILFSLHVSTLKSQSKSSYHASYGFPVRTSSHPTACKPRAGCLYILCFHVCRANGAHANFRVNQKHESTQNLSKPGHTCTTQSTCKQFPLS